MRVVNSRGVSPSAPMPGSPPRSEIDLEAHEQEVRVRIAGQVASLRVDVVRHDARHRVDVPVDADARVPELAAGEAPVVQVEVGDAAGDFPSSRTGAEVALRPGVVENALSGVVAAVLAGQEPARLDVGALEQD